MKTVHVHGASLEGTGALIVTVEARFEGKEDGPTEIHLTGLPDSVLRESRGRLACILQATRLGLGSGRLFLNLVPAARRKSGEALDLALVLAAAAAGGHLSPRQVQDTLFFGEVGIDGRLHATPGGLAAAVAARSRGIQRLVAPVACAQEAAALESVDAYGATAIADVLRHLTRDPGEPGTLPEAVAPPTDPKNARDPSTLDDVRGQGEAKLALRVAAAGGHGLLLIGPPGAGKSMLARRLVDLLPPPDLGERVEVTAILSATGRWPKGLAERRPFRAPHHTTSFAGLIGGGNPIQPGEITLAHRGVLFLDELPEFGREALEGLRQPLEEGAVHLARAGRRTSLPASFQLVAAMNPCPCGHAGHPRIPCHCPPSAVRRYRRRISGPLMDRIDLVVTLQPASVEVLVGHAAIDSVASTGPPAPASAACESNAGPAETQGSLMGAAVLRARARAAARHASANGKGTCLAPAANAHLTPKGLDAVAALDRDSTALLSRAATRLELSARAVQSVRRVARTLADLDDRETIDAKDVAAALSLRSGAAER